MLRHPTIKDLRKRFNTGDLTAHAWNPQIAQRMRQYQPYVIGLDSVTGAFKTPANDASWIWLPGSPKEMTSREKVYIVGGDLLHFHLIGFGSYSKNEIDWGKQLDEKGWKNVNDYATGILAVEFLGEHVALPLSMLLAFRLLSRKRAEDDKEIRNPSRRALLKKAVVGIGAFAILSFFGKLTPLIQSYSPTSISEKPTRIMTDTVKPITRSTWLEGRTALVISKTMEAMKRLDVPQGAHGSVVMGFPHDYEAGSFLTNKQARMDAIRKYAEVFFEHVYPTIPYDIWREIALAESYRDDIPDDETDALKDFVNDFKNTKAEEWKRQYIMDTLLPFFTATIIYTVKEPNSYQVDDPHNAVRDLLDYTDYFPGEEVTEAVSPLGDPQRFPIEEPF